MPAGFKNNLFSPESEILADWLACSQDGYEPFLEWYWNSPQSVSLRNYQIPGFHLSLLSHDLDSYLNEMVGLNHFLIQKMGMVCLAKASVALDLGQVDEAFFNLEYAFTVAHFLMHSDGWGGRSAAHLFLNGLELIRNRWQKDQVHAAMLELLPTQNAFAFHMQKFQWLQMTQALQAVEREMTQPSQKSAGYYFNRLMGFDFERLRRVVFEDFQHFSGQLNSPWLNWQPSPSSGFRNQNALTDCYYDIALTAEIIGMDLHRETFGRVLLESALTELDLRLALANELRSPETVEKVFSESGLLNPYTQQPFTLDADGNVVLTLGKDVSEFVFRKLEKSSGQHGLVLREG